MLPWNPPQEQGASASNQGNGGFAGSQDAGPSHQQQGAVQQTAQSSLNLASVLLFLQSEFRRHERDRNVREVEVTSL